MHHLDHPKKQTDAELIKELLAEGLKREAAAMRFWKIVFWTVFSIMEIITITTILASDIMEEDFNFGGFLLQIFFVFLVNMLLLLQLKQIGDPNYRFYNRFCKGIYQAVRTII